MPFRIPRASISRKAQVSSATFSTGPELVCVGNSWAPFDIPGVASDSCSSLVPARNGCAVHFQRSDPLR
jgi:hypothetical protein